LLRIAADERLDQSRLAHAGRANDADDDRGCFFGEAVDERNVQAFLFDLRALA
jgi:hypothetical protein